MHLLKGKDVNDKEIKALLEKIFFPREETTKASVEKMCSVAKRLRTQRKKAKLERARNYQSTKQ